MAELVKFIKATTLPGTLQPDTFYFVQNGNYAESYLTDKTGVAKNIGNTAMITAIINNIVVPASQMMVASEDLSAGNWVNVWDSSGAKVRKASASVAGRETHGFVLDSVTAGNSVLVHFSGINSQLSGQTPGFVYLSASVAGSSTSSPPSSPGNIIQQLGVAISATSVAYNPCLSILLS